MNVQKLTLAALVLLACGPNFPDQPCGAKHVTASLSSVTLASDCGGGAKGVAADAACADGFACPSLCRQSSMQLAFGSLATHPANIEIRAVRLIDPSSKKVLQTLTSREPQQWSADKYLAWDELLAPGATVKATYKLSAPTFYYPAALTDGRSAYQPYRVEVDVAIDGEVRTLQADATREPEVAT